MTLCRPESRSWVLTRADAAMLVRRVRILYRLLASLARLAVRSGRSKDLELIVLRKQNAVLRRQIARPALTDNDRTMLGATWPHSPVPLEYSRVSADQHVCSPSWTCGARKCARGCRPARMRPSWRVVSRILYAFLASLARLAVRSGHSKDLEIIVLRHQLHVSAPTDRPARTQR